MEIITIFVLFVSFAMWIWEKSKDNSRFKIFLAMYVSFLAGIFGELLNLSFNLNLSGLGTILSVVVMGAFILKYNNK